MKTKRTLFLVVLAILLITALVGGSYAGANTSSYQIMAKNENWDAQIDKAVAQRRDVVSFLSYETITTAPEAFETIYVLGPEAVPYILDRIQESGQDGGEEAFLVAAVSFVLQDTVHYKATDNPHLGGTPQYHAYNLRAFLEEVPDLVTTSALRMRHRRKNWSSFPSWDSRLCRISPRVSSRARPSGHRIWRPSSWGLALRSGLKP